MKNMNNKTKKWLTVAGCLVGCAVLVGFIGNQFKTEPLTDEPLPSQSSQALDVTVDMPDTEKEKDVVVTQPDIPTTSQPVETLPPQTDLPEQKIQPDPVKPQAPKPPKTQEGTDKTPSTDKDHVFAPESPDVPPTYKPEEMERKPPENKPEPSTPQNVPQEGETESGKIYVPGFGLIDDIGEGQGSVAEDMYENGNKIGIMD